MSLKMVSPFSCVPRISEEINVDTARCSLKRIRDVVAGKDTTFPRSRGMAILQTTDFPNKHRDFEAVLENENESPEIRYLAAIYLGKIATSAAIEILIRNSRIDNESVLAGVMKALGCIGDKAAFDAISTVKRRGKRVSSNAG